MPVVLISATGLWQSRQRTAVALWLSTLALAIAITLASKILFLGWGLGSETFDFTGISGHALLATSVLPVFFGWLLTSDQPRFSPAGAVFGSLLAVAVGVSRVLLGAHSPSEVAAAWIVGAPVSALALKAMNGAMQRPWYARLVPLVLLSALGASTSTYLPTHDWEIDLSLRLSGRSRPFVRPPATSPLAPHVAPAPSAPR